jgi:hypothetical protein
LIRTNEVQNKNTGKKNTDQNPNNFQKKAKTQDYAFQNRLFLLLRHSSFIIAFWRFLAKKKPPSFSIA